MPIGTPLDVDRGNVRVQIQGGVADAFVEFSDSENIIFIRPESTTEEDVGFYKVQILLFDAETPRDPPGFYSINIAIVASAEEADKILNKSKPEINWKALFVTRSLQNS